VAPPTALPSMAIDDIEDAWERGGDEGGGGGGGGVHAEPASRAIGPGRCSIPPPGAVEVRDDVADTSVAPPAGGGSSEYSPPRSLVRTGLDEICSEALAAFLDAAGRACVVDAAPSMLPEDEAAAPIADCPARLRRRD